MTGHRLRTGPVMGVTFISYAFNLNLGALVGGIAFRYRLYSRLGLDSNTITRVLGFSMLTNWFGYLVVAGAAFCFWPMSLPPDWKIGDEGLRILGAVLLLARAGSTWSSAPLRASTPGACAVTSSTRRRCASRCFSWSSPASTGR